MSFARTLAVALALVACTKKTPPPPLVVEASAPVSAAGPLDDLLHFTDAHLAVSSKVDNPRDFAEHIADGRLDTAWNGKSGDLVGAWIGFRVPRAARVRLVELTSPCEDMKTVPKRCSGTELAAEDGVRICSFNTSAVPFVLWPLP